MSEAVEKKTLLTSKEVNKAWLLWLFNNQACYNYERMMGIGFSSCDDTGISKILQG